MKDTLLSQFIKFRILFGKLIEIFGLSLQPNYWACNKCGHIELKEKEVYCWNCNIGGEMIYQGEIK